MAIPMSHCSTCGVPIEGAICAVCGGTSERLVLTDGRGDLPEVPADARKPELEWAFEAWARGEHGRVVSHCLSAEGAQGIKSRTVPEGPAFVAVIGGIAIVIRVDTRAGLLCLETPVARLPKTQYVGAMRLALELSAETRSAARYAVRADTLLLRIMGRLDAMTPAIVQGALRSLVAQATDDAKVFSTSVLARVVPAKEHVDIDLESLPEPARLELEPAQNGRKTGRPTVPVDPEMSLPPMPSLSAPKPANLGGLRAGGAPPSRSSQPPRELAPQEPALKSSPPPATQSKVPPLKLREPAARAQDAKLTPFRPLHAIALPAAGELCELLHKAQTIGAVLSFADQPATMALLIRATVYRVTLAYEASLPGAVGLLYTETVPLTKEIYITAPGIRRGAMAIPSANPAFEAMQKIVDAGGDLPKGAPLTNSPSTSLHDAKQHLARYVSEIDQAPKDLELRHFLALGALAELLVRAKLPAPTLERLRGLMAHAERDGATQQLVDLMMTALTRMMA